MIPLFSTMAFNIYKNINGDRRLRLGTLGAHGNGSFRSYSCLDPGSFRSYSLSVRSFRPGLFHPHFRGGSFWPNSGGSFRPTLFYIVFLCVKSFSGYPGLILYSFDR